MWQQAGLIPVRPPVYHRLEKQPQHIYGQFRGRQGAFVCVSLDCGEEAGEEPRIPKKKKKKKPALNRAAFYEGDVSNCRRPQDLELSCRRAMWCLLLWGGHLPIKKPLWTGGGNVLSIWGRVRGSNEHTHGERWWLRPIYWGGPLIPFQPPSPFLCVGYTAPHSSNREEQRLRVAAPSQPVLMKRHWVWAPPPSPINGPGCVRARG